MLTKALFTAYTLSSTVVAISAQAQTRDLFDDQQYAAANVIRRDVAIIGGGSSGIYTAVHLKDAKKSVAVIEQKPVIGGHAETFIDPVSKTAVNLGVIVFGNTSTVHDYFNRFNVPLVPLVDPGQATANVNFDTGKVVHGYTAPSAAAMGAAFRRYAQQLAKSGVATGSGFNMSYPVAEDLLLPFGDLVTKYNLGAFMRTLFTVNQGYAPLLNISTLYMYKYLNAVELASLSNGFLTSGTGNTHSLYDAIQPTLADGLFLNSTITKVDRSDASQVKIAFKSNGVNKLVIARKMVSCIPPVISNLNGWDLTSTETSLFKQFFANGYYTGTLNNTGLTKQLGAMDLRNAYALQTLPNPYGFAPIPNTTLTSIYYGSPSVDSSSTVQQRIGQALNRYQKANGLPVTPIDFVAFSSHAPFNLMVGNTAIKNGFYRKVDKMQGASNTFWNGAWVEAQDSTAIWEFSKTVLIPRILSAM